MMMMMMVMMMVVVMVMMIMIKKLVNENEFHKPHSQIRKTLDVWKAQLSHHLFGGGGRGTVRVTGEADDISPPGFAVFF
jgi:hypothetical protein